MTSEYSRSLHQWLAMLKPVHENISFSPFSILYSFISNRIIYHWLTQRHSTIHFKISKADKTLLQSVTTAIPDLSSFILECEWTLAPVPVLNMYCTSINTLQKMFFFMANLNPHTLLSILNWYWLRGATVIHATPPPHPLFFSGKLCANIRHTPIGRWPSVARDQGPLRFP